MLRMNAEKILELWGDPSFPGNFRLLNYEITHLLFDFKVVQKVEKYK